MNDLEKLLDPNDNHFNLRFWRDFGRLKSLLNKNDDINKCFDKAEGLVNNKK